MASRWRGSASGSTGTSWRWSTRIGPQPAARLYRIYGDASFERDETGTDLAAVAHGRIAVTPIHFDLTDHEGLTALQRYDLARLIEPAASELEP